jgi:hypothetical protein
MFAGWQDVVVTVVALGAAVTVVWRTLGAWSDSQPGTGTAGCDHCAVKKVHSENEAMRQ